MAIINTNWLATTANSKHTTSGTYFGLQTDSIPWFSAAGEKSNAKEVAFGVEAERNGSQSLPYPPMHREHNLK